MQPIERHIQVRKTARYYIVGEPGPDTREVWICCHGYGQLAAPFIAALEPLHHPKRVIVAPEALNRFYMDEIMKRHGPDSPVGAAWMTREDRDAEIEDYIAYLDVVAESVVSQVDSHALRVVALGFSQSVATVSRWAAFGRRRVDTLVLWGGSIATDLPTERGAQLFSGANVVFVAGRKDSFATVKYVQGEADRLRQAGVNVETLEHDGGHALSSVLLRQLGATLVANGV